MLELNTQPDNEEFEVTSYKAIILPKVKTKQGVAAKKVAKLDIDVEKTEQFSNDKLVGIPTTSSDLVKNSYHLETQALYDGKYFGGRIQEQTNTSHEFHLLGEPTIENQALNFDCKELIGGTLKTKLVVDGEEE